jgi:hypothetical protein
MSEDIRTVPLERLGDPKFRLSQREREQLDLALQQMESNKLPIILMATRARLYFDALKIEGFSEEQALEIVKFTLALLRT